MRLSARLKTGILVALLLIRQGSSAPAALQLAVYYDRGIPADGWHDFVAIAAAMEHAGHTVRSYDDPLRPLSLEQAPPAWSGLSSSW